MPAFGFHPFAAQQPQRFQTAEQRVHGSLRHNQIGIALEPPQNFETVELSAPQSRQDCQFEASLSKLDFPLISNLSIAIAFFHRIYFVLQGIVLSTLKSLFEFLLVTVQPELRKQIRRLFRAWACASLPATLQLNVA